MFRVQSHFNFVLLTLLIFVGCSDEMVSSSGKKLSPNESDLTGKSEPGITQQQGKQPQRLTRLPINQFESRDQIIILANAINAVIKDSSKTDEQKLSEILMDMLQLGEDFGLLRKYCQKSQDQLFNKRLDFLIAFHHPIGDMWLKNVDSVKTPVGEVESDPYESHSNFLELIMRNKKPELFNQIGEQGLDRISSQLLRCPSFTDDICGKITRFPLIKEIDNPISFCADYVEAYYRKVLEPRNQVDKYLKDNLDESSLESVMSAMGGIPLAVFDPVRGDTGKREEIIRIVEKHHPGNAEKLRKWVITKRRRLVQDIQESAKHYLVLVQQAEQEFRDNDANSNGVKDYWVADVSGLYRLQADPKLIKNISLKSMNRSESEDNATWFIGLLDIQLAQLDTAALPDSTLGCIDLPKPVKQSQILTDPYRLQAVPRDASGKKFATATKISGHKWFNKDQFVFCAYPTQYPKLGRNTYLIDQSKQLWMKDTQGKPVEQKPADYEDEGWSKTKITPKYVKELINDAGLIKYKTRVMNLDDELLYQIQQREMLIKAGVIKKRTMTGPVKYDREAVLAALDNAIGQTKVIDWEIKDALLTMRKCVEDDNTTLNLEFSHISTLPQEIGLLTNLKELNLSHSGFTSLPPEIGMLTKLIDLNITECKLTSLPPEIKTLTKIKNLSIAGNALTVLPPEIGELTELNNLDIGNNNLTALPPEVGKLINLTNLNIGANELIALPSEIGNLENLSKLDLGGNPISLLPPEIGNLVNLTSVDLYFSKISSLPPEIGKLQNLKILNLVGNNLTTLPPEIGKLTNLTRLDLAANPITSLPPEIGELTKLKILDLRLKLITLTELSYLESLENLEILYLKRNKVTENGQPGLKNALPKCKIKLE